ncbi:MAG: hypothetical protein IPI14_04590 [Polaromonas sp.]|nr:hypothetical protein [Polaromonas sp.]
MKQKRCSRAMGDTVSVRWLHVSTQSIQRVPGKLHRRCGRSVTVTQWAILKNLHPEKRAYFVKHHAHDRTAIDAGLLRDVYVSMGRKFRQQAYNQLGLCACTTSHLSVGFGVVAC